MTLSVPPRRSSVLEDPRRAQLLRQGGTAQLYFVMDRGGRVLEYRILESSGYKLLDEEVVAMVKRASPLPPPPAAMPGERLDYIVPVEFFQRCGLTGRSPCLTVEVAGLPYGVIAPLST